MSSRLLFPDVPIIVDVLPDSGSAQPRKEMQKEVAAESCPATASNEPMVSSDLVLRPSAVHPPPPHESESVCRICQVSLDESDPDVEKCRIIELGCCCKDDLASAHRHCAETWFKIKGDKICEICGSVARNISETLLIDPFDVPTHSTMFSTAEATELQNCGQGRRILNFILGCVIFFFVISWLFHFN